MIHILDILVIVFIHYVADFIFQTEYMSMNKSKSNKVLFNHVFVYSLTWFIIGICIFPIFNVLLFSSITFIAHFITDYITSRWTGKLHLNKNYYGFPGFFSVIGLDQLLHYFQLFITFILIYNL